MPTVTAAEGDTLCTIAAANGFENCLPLRQVQVNIDRGYRDNALKAGDQVEVPAPAVRDEAARATEVRHDFEAPNMPPPGIRFVHGASGTPFADDVALPFLNISNYPTDKAGADGQQAWPTTFGFNQHADADPDVFKIEVVDPNAGSNTVEVRLKAMRPVYEADGTIRVVAGVRQYQDFTTELAMRQIRLQCQTVNNARQVRFRSRYMRLVVDDQDFNAISANNQALLVADTADGSNGDADKVEILDQVVVASYELVHCPAPAGQAKCRAEATRPVGNDRLRIPVACHVMRPTALAAGGAAGTGVGGVTEQHVRQRVGRWLRRTYAQAEMAPKWVAPNVVFYDPPAENMLAIGQHLGTPAMGGADLEFDLATPPPVGGPAPAAPAPAGPAAPAPAAPAPPHVRVTLAADMTPEQVATAVVAAMPAGYSATPHRNCMAFSGVNHSYDVMITKDDGTEVMIDNLNNPDWTLDVRVARVAINSVDSVRPADALLLNTPEFRRVIRQCTVADNRIDIIVVGGFSTANLLGRAFPPAAPLDADHTAHAPERWGVMVRADTMNGGDDFPFVLSHEMCHVLYDSFHTKDTSNPGFRTELMYAFADNNNSLAACKRMCDTPVHIIYNSWDPAHPDRFASIERSVFMVTVLLRPGSRPVREAW
jgi:hypothetical protein